MSVAAAWAVAALLCCCTPSGEAVRSCQAMHTFEVLTDTTRRGGMSSSYLQCASCGTTLCRFENMAGRGGQHDRPADLVSTRLRLTFCPAQTPDLRSALAEARALYLDFRFYVGHTLLLDPCRSLKHALSQTVPLPQARPSVTPFRISVFLDTLHHGEFGFGGVIWCL